jgi:hypothetical protein
VIPIKNKPIKRYGGGNDSITGETSPEIIREKSNFYQSQVQNLFNFNTFLDTIYIG